MNEARVVGVLFCITFDAATSSLSLSLFPRLSVILLSFHEPIIVTWFVLQREAANRYEEKNIKIKMHLVSTHRRQVAKLVA